MVIACLVVMYLRAFKRTIRLRYGTLACAIIIFQIEISQTFSLFTKISNQNIVVILINVLNGDLIIIILNLLCCNL